MTPTTELDGCNARQDALRSDVSRIVGAGSLLALRQLNVRHTFVDAAVIYALIAGTLVTTWVLHAHFGPWCLLAAPLLACVTGVAFNWINAQLHEASHHLLLPSKRWNDRYCNWALGALALQDVQTYRATHGMHHSQLHTQNDPDLPVYTTYVGSSRHVARGLLRDLSMLTLLERVRHVAAFFERYPRLRPKVPLALRCGQVGGQVLLLAAFVSTCGAWGAVYYLSIYAYGLLGVFPALIRIRTVVEHYRPAGDGEFVSRSTVPPLLQRWMVGARMDYHFEHHLFPNVPYYNLKVLNRALTEAGLFETPAALTGPAFLTTDYVQSYGRLAREPEAC